MLNFLVFILFSQVYDYRCIPVTFIEWETCTQPHISGSVFLLLLLLFNLTRRLFMTWDLYKAIKTWNKTSIRNNMPKHIKSNIRQIHYRPTQWRIKHYSNLAHAHGTVKQLCDLSNSVLERRFVPEKLTDVDMCTEFFH